MKKIILMILILLFLIGCEDQKETTTTAADITTTQAAATTTTTTTIPVTTTTSTTTTTITTTTTTTLGEPILKDSDESVTLADYPDMFFRNGKTTCKIITGTQHPTNVDVAVEISAVTEIISGLGREGQVAVGSTVLDSEVTDMTQDMIVVGGPCTNLVARQLLGRSDCNDITPGEPQLRLFQSGGYDYLLILSASASDTQKAAKVLKDYPDYDLTGTTAVISGSISSPAVS